MPPSKARRAKLYCYVDETDQDTLGKLFIVVTVIARDQRQTLLDFLEQAERESGGRRNQPWSKKNRKRREKYLDAAFKTDQLEGTVFYQVFKDIKDFECLTAETVVRALSRYAAEHNLPAYKATIIIDGLSKKATSRVRRVILAHGIRIDKIRGERDESSPILRLADVLARLIRGAIERNWDYRSRVQKYQKDGIISNLG